MCRWNLLCCDFGGAKWWWAAALFAVAITQCLFNFVNFHNGFATLYISVFGWTYVSMIVTGLVYNKRTACSTNHSTNSRNATRDGEPANVVNVVGQGDDSRLLQLTAPLLSSNHHPEGTLVPVGNNNEGTASQQHQGQRELSTPEVRLHYLDNLRIFLVGVVVTGHSISEAINTFWYPKIDAVATPQIGFGVKIPIDIIQLCVPVVMPCFFGIAGYVTPSSFKRAGCDKIKFWNSKRNRLWKPAMFTSLFLVPLEEFYIRLLWDHQRKIEWWWYYPNPMHAWFLLTLLVFQFMYCTFQTEDGATNASHAGDEEDVVTDLSSSDHHDSETQERPDESPPSNEQLQTPQADAIAVITATTVLPPTSLKPFPSFWRRFLYGFVIGGLVTSLGGNLFAPNGLNLQDWPRHLVLFWAGVHGYRNDWLRPEILRQHIDAIRRSAAIEFCILFGMMTSYLYLKPSIIMGIIDSVWGDLLGLVLIWIGGAASVDMTLMLVYYFQVYCNQPWPEFFRKSSYGVYIIHHIVMTLVAITTANVILEEQQQPEPQQQREDVDDDSSNNMDYLLFTTHQRWYGFVVTVVGTHFVSWSLAYCGLRP